MPQVGANNEPLHNRALYGFDGTDWQKLSLVFGYSDALSEVVANSNLSAGTNTINGTVVPAGEIWIVTNASIYYVGTVPTAIFYKPTVDGTSLVLDLYPSPVTTKSYPLSGNVILKTGDKMAAEILGATAGDDFNLYYCGYKMEVS